MTQISLFSDNRKSLRIHNGWTNLLSTETLNRAADIESTINCMRTTLTIYPDKKDVFRALQLDPEKVKVVILGQDPYYNGNATGLAFGCKLNVSPSLKQILTAMNKQYKRSGKHNNRTLMSLSHLPLEGVLLLNTILTVKEKEPLSHKKLGWEKITKELLQNFSIKYKNVVYMLWGGEAIKYENILNSKNNLILKNSHPAFASRENREWNCNHFKEANEYLIKHNKKPIEWL